MDQDWVIEVERAVLNSDAFLKATFSGKPRGQSVWTKVSIRPVVIKGVRHLQFMYYDDKRSQAHNYMPGAAAQELKVVAQAGFEHVNVQSTTGDLHIRLTKKGKALVSRAKPSRAEAAPNLSHNQTKEYLLSGDASDLFLKGLGIKSLDGNIKPTMQDKFKQINEFLRVIETALPNVGDRVLHAIDCGSGSAYLTFAAFHYITGIKGIPLSMVGVDTNPKVVEKSQRLRDELGWEKLNFVVSSIVEYKPKAPPDLVLSLHACDTATDEAIARGILWGSKSILAAPCCQHELHNKIDDNLFRPVLRHGVLRERLADVLTDAFRALVLRIMGYSTDVIEFVSPEHTSKNLMIRAIKTVAPGDPKFVQEYLDMENYWRVKPVIAELVGEPLSELLYRQ